MSEPQSVLGSGHESDWASVWDAKWDPNKAWDAPKHEDGVPPYCKKHGDEEGWSW